MDSLFHLLISFIGGFVFFTLAGIRFRPAHLFLVSLLSLSIDFQHVFEAFGLFPIFHAFYFALIPFLAAAYFNSRRQLLLFNYSILLSVMLFGHLFSDMIQGMYGIPIFYPFSSRLFLLPWDLLTFNGAPIIGSAGLAMLLYFGLIYLSASAVASPQAGPPSAKARQKALR